MLRSALSFIAPAARISRSQVVSAVAAGAPMGARAGAATESMAAPPITTMAAMGVTAAPVPPMDERGLPVEAFSDADSINAATRGQDATVLSSPPVQPQPPARPRLRRSSKGARKAAPVEPTPVMAASPPISRATAKSFEEPETVSAVYAMETYSFDPMQVSAMGGGSFWGWHAVRGLAVAFEPVAAARARSSERPTTPPDRAAKMPDLEEDVTRGLVPAPSPSSPKKKMMKKTDKRVMKVDLGPIDGGHGAGAKMQAAAAAGR